MSHTAAPLGFVLRQSTLYLIGNMVSRAVGFLMIPFYSRFLSTAQYGVLNLIELATSVVAIVFGLQAVGQVLTRVHHDAADERAGNAVVSTALIFTVLLAGAITLAAMLCAEPIARAINLPGNVALLRAAFAAMFLGSLSEVVLVWQRIRGAARFFVAYSLTTLLCTVGLNLGFIGVAHLGVWGFVSSKLVVTGAGCCFLLVRAARQVGVAWRGALIGDFVRFGAPLVLSGAAYFVIHFSDRVFLAHTSLADVGRYSLAYNFAFLLSILIGDSFAKSWDVRFYREAQGEGWQARFAQVAKWLMLVLATTAAGISLFGLDGLRLMVPRSYDPPTLLLPILVFGYFFREVGDFFRNMLLLDRRSGLVGRIAVGGAVLNLALNFWLIPRHGILGAAAATFLTWAAYCAACWTMAAQIHGQVVRPWALARLLAIAALVLAGYLALRPAGAIAAIAADAGWFTLFLSLAALLYLGRTDRQWLLAQAMEKHRARLATPPPDPC